MVGGSLIGALDFTDNLITVSDNCYLSSRSESRDQRFVLELSSRAKPRDLRFAGGGTRLWVVTTATLRRIEPEGRKSSSPGR